MTYNYYTPEIEEFHVGFECEYRYDPESRKCRNCKGDLYTREGIDPDCIHSGSFYTPPSLYEWKPIIIACDDLLYGNYDQYTFLSEPYREFRVKFLDKEDIESLGFELYQNLADDYEFEWHIIFNNSRIGMFYEGNESLDDPNIEFYGTQYYIKNKSELKKLLKQLNIHFDGK